MHTIIPVFFGNDVIEQVVFSRDHKLLFQKQKSQQNRCAQKMVDSFIAPTKSLKGGVNAIRCKTLDKQQTNLSDLKHQGILNKGETETTVTN